jgi:SsrA-binding protein
VKSEKSQSACKELISVRKVSYEYEILQTFETGIVLLGTEIKSLRAGGGSLAEAYVTLIGRELFLINSSIPAYKFGSFANHEEKRKRKLLAHSREINEIGAALAEKGLTCVPLSLYLKNGRAKLKIAICRGKKLYDKRKAIQERQEKRAVDRAMRNFSE